MAKTRSRNPRSQAKNRQRKPPAEPQHKRTHPKLTGPERAARRKAEAAKARRRVASRRFAWIAIGSVLVVVAGLVVVKIVTRPSAAGKSGLTSPAVVRQVADVPESTLDAVGAGTSRQLPAALPPTTPPLEAGGLPHVVYVGAEYCPYCAAQRWPLVMALSRFGRFTGLGESESATDDVYPGTKTFTFHGSSYSSPYLVFTGVETHTNQPALGGGYTTLETPTAEENRIISTFDRPPYVPSSGAGAIPFLDIANRWVMSGTGVSPQVLQGMSMEQIAGKLSSPSDPVAQGIDGSANVLTAAICDATGNEPANVCGSKTISSIQAQLRSQG